MHQHHLGLLAHAAEIRGGIEVQGRRTAAGLELTSLLAGSAAEMAEDASVVAERSRDAGRSWQKISDDLTLIVSELVTNAVRHVLRDGGDAGPYSSGAQVTAETMPYHMHWRPECNTGRSHLHVAASTHGGNGIADYRCRPRVG